MLASNQKCVEVRVFVIRSFGHSLAVWCMRVTVLTRMFLDMCSPINVFHIQYIRLYLLSIYIFKKVTWLPSFVAAVRPEFLRSWRPSVRVEFFHGGHPSVGIIQFAFGSFYADCPHKRIIYWTYTWKGRRCNLNQYDSVKNIAFIQVFCVEPIKSMRLAGVFTLG